MSKYWIVNFITNQYFPIVDEGNFFGDDWKLKTPWPTSRYSELSAQKIYSDQVLQENVFYNYDLTQGGMIVGLYYDRASCKLKDAHAHIKRLRQQHDVVSVYYHGLTLCEIPDTSRAVDTTPDIERLRELQRTINIINDSGLGSFDKWDIPSNLRAAIYNYQIMKERLNEELQKYNIEEL